MVHGGMTRNVSHPWIAGRTTTRLGAIIERLLGPSQVERFFEPRYTSVAFVDGKKVTRDANLFSGYAFIKANQWNMFESVSGFFGVVTTVGGSAYRSNKIDDLVEHLMGMRGKDDLLPSDCMPTLVSRFKVGDAVIGSWRAERLESATFAGIRGVVDRVFPGGVEVAWRNGMRSAVSEQDVELDWLRQRHRRGSKSRGRRKCSIQAA
jgi:transcription antitermination factor NusG